MGKELRVADLRDVMQNLKDAGFKKADWEELGLELGLHQNTLDAITQDQGNVNKCFIKCLTNWLQRADEVDQCHGKPTFNSLAAALEKIGKKNEAEHIRGLFERDSAEGKKAAKSTGPKIDSTKKSGAGNKDGGAQASAGDEEIDGPAPQDPPQDKKKGKYVEFKEDLVQDIEILLLPATDTEEKPVMDFLEQSSEEYIETDIDDTVKMYIGYYGKSKVIVSKIAPDKTMQGPVHAAIITTKIIERVKSIKHVVAVGVCFGKDPEKHKFGEVIISEMICDFVSKRQGVGIELRRGGDYMVKSRTKKKFYISHDLVLPDNIKVSTGPIVTTPNLIDNPEIKKELFDKKPEAIAGEMEGAGIMAAIDYAPERVGVIVIKGIGDWGDGKKEEAVKWKPIAARNAAQYVHAVLNK